MPAFTPSHHLPSHTLKKITGTFLLALAPQTACTGVIDDPHTREHIESKGAAFACRRPPDVRAVEIPLRRITPTQYRNAVREIFNGAITPSDRFPEQSGSSETGFTTEPPLNAVTELAAELLLEAAEDVAVQVPAALPEIVNCSGMTDSACADTFMDTVALRAFRRPPTQEEQAQLRDVYNDARADLAPHAEALAMVTAVVMQTPQFLYLPEVGTGSGELRRLTGYEIASRLSFLIWDSPPDEALLDAAATGRLEHAGGIGEEARRMLADPKSNAMIERFFREWMHVDELSGGSRDQDLHPWFTNQLASNYGESFRRYLRTAVREGWTLGELLTSSMAPVNGALAEFYGVDPPAAGWEWVEMDPSRSVGLMTQPAAMASFAHYGESSYVLRGRFIISGLLCLDLGSPPGNAVTEAGAIIDALPPTAGARDVSNAIRATQPCGLCHDSMDPPGLAFENFDATGRWRSRDAHGSLIETHGELPAAGLEFDGPRSLMEGLAQQDEVATCLTRQLFRYFASREERSADECALQQLALSQDQSLRDAIIALTESDTFQHQIVSEEGE